MNRTEKIQPVIYDCYTFRDVQVGVNKKFSNHMLLIDSDKRYVIAERRNRTIVFDRVIRILTIITLITVAIFVAMKTF